MPNPQGVNPRQRSMQSMAVAVCMFVMGGCGMAYEYTLSKIASDILGNSVQQWAIVIALMLFCMGMGAELQRHVKDRKLIDTLAQSQAALALLGGFGSLAMLHVFSAFPSHFALVQYGLVSAIGTLIGFEIPLITRINEQFSADVKSNLARILKMDYIGALIGALLWVFVLFRYFSMVQTGLILALTTLLSTLGLVAAFRNRTENLGRLCASIVGVGVLVACGFLFEKPWTESAEQRLYRDRIIFSETSKYQHIVLTESHSGNLACYINGHLQFNSVDEHIYHEQLVHPAMQIARRRDNVLILGGGDGLALREVLKYPDVRSVTLVDLDPDMTELAAHNEHFVRLNQNSLASAKLHILKNGAIVESGQATVTIGRSTEFDPDYTREVATVCVLNIDAAAFVAQAQGMYDVILVDFPDPNSVELAKLYSQHFYGFLRQRLNADGILVTQSTSPYHAKEVFLCVGRTMKSAGLCVVPYHDNVPSFGEWAWWIGGRDSNTDASELRNRLSSLSDWTEPTRYITPELVRASLSFGRNDLVTGENAVNTITNPCIHNYYLDAWKSRRGMM